MAKQSNFKYGIQLGKNVSEPLHLGNQYINKCQKKSNQIFKYDLAWHAILRYDNAYFILVITEEPMVSL